MVSQRPGGGGGGGGGRGGGLYSGGGGGGGGDPRQDSYYLMADAGRMMDNAESKGLFPGRGPLWEPYIAIMLMLLCLSYGQPILPPGDEEAVWKCHNTRRGSKVSIYQYYRGIQIC